MLKFKQIKNQSLYNQIWIKFINSRRNQASQRPKGLNCSLLKRSIRILVLTQRKMHLSLIKRQPIYNMKKENFKRQLQQVQDQMTISCQQIQVEKLKVIIDHLQLNRHLLIKKHQPTKEFKEQCKEKLFLEVITNTTQQEWNKICQVLEQKQVLVQQTQISETQIQAKKYQVGKQQLVKANVNSVKLYQLELTQVQLITIHEKQ